MKTRENCGEARSVPKVALSLAISVVSSFDDGAVSREEWDELVESVGGDLYSTFDWCRIWWRHYGDNRGLRIFICRFDGRLVGLAPMFVEKIWLGPIRFKLAKRVGADYALSTFSLALRTEFAEAVFHNVISYLVDQDRCDAVWFGLMPGNDQTTGSLRAASQSLRDQITVARDAPAGVHTIFNLPNKFDAYLGGLTKNARQNYRRNVNLIKRDFSVQWDAIRDASKAQSSFREFVDLHQSQWRAEGKPGHFGDWPKSMQFNIDLVDQLSKLGRFRMVRIVADGDTISSYYSFVFAGCCYWRLPARAPDEKWRRYALGRLGLIGLIEEMIREGVLRIEGGIGQYDYKAQLGATEHELRSILIGSLRRTSRVRSCVFVIAADMLHLLYYRIWRLKIAPALSMSIGPLSKTWIRLRL